VALPHKREPATGTRQPTLHGDEMEASGRVLFALSLSCEAIDLRPG